MKDKLEKIFEVYYIYNKKGELLPLLKTDLGKELFGESCVLIGSIQKRGPSEAVTLSPASNIDSDELWDRHSETIDTDIDTLQYYAGKVVMTHEKYKKLIAEILSNTASNKTK